MKILSLEHKQNISNGLKRAYQKGIRKSLKGIKLSEEHKRKISVNSSRYWLGKKGPPVSIETRQKMSKAQMGNKRALGYRHTEEAKKRISKNNWMKKNSGKDNPSWKGGVQKNERNDPAYHQWVKVVKKRDNNTCWLSDENCLGYNIVHHIKNWREYLKLRYELTNGITLCQAHHPKGRAKEKLFEKLFSYLVIQK